MEQECPPAFGCMAIQELFVIFPVKQIVIISADALQSDSFAFRIFLGHCFNHFGGSLLT